MQMVLYQLYSDIDCSKKIRARFIDFIEQLIDEGVLMFKNGIEQLENKVIIVLVKPVQKSLVYYR